MTYNVFGGTLNLAQSVCLPVWPDSLFVCHIIECVCFTMSDDIQRHVIIHCLWSVSTMAVPSRRPTTDFAPGFTSAQLLSDCIILGTGSCIIVLAVYVSANHKASIYCLSVSVWSFSDINAVHFLGRIVYV